MEPVTWILGGVVITGVSVTIGKIWGTNGKVTDQHCSEKQIACQNLVIEKIGNVGRKVDDLAKLVNDKLISL